MSVRLRLFLLLVALSVLPMLLLRLNARMHILELSDDLVGRTRHLLVEKAKSHMLLMVEDHAELWRRETLLLEQTLRLQMAEVEAALAASGGKPSADLDQAYKAAASHQGITVLGQVTVFESGAAVASGEPVHLPARADARQARWYLAAREHKGLAWTAPVADPATGRMALTLSAPVRDPSGRLAGVTALVVPLSIGGMSEAHAASISSRLKTYLVDYASPEVKAKGLRLIGEADAKEPPAGEADLHDRPDAPGHQPGRGRHMRLKSLEASAWLSPDDPAELSAILADLGQGESGVRQAELGSKDFIWAYAPSGATGLALVILAPKTDVSAEAFQASRYIEQSIAGQLRFTLFILAGALALVTLAAWVVSRSVTRPVTDLARASRLLGRGDFTVRVEPAGGPEFEELGRAFNDMVPALEERTRLCESMELAREVHRRLIPAELPRVPGLDMAGASIASQETGGDSFDVIDHAHGGGRVAALVGDVSGHGLDATLLMATARAYLRMRALQPGTPAQVVTDVNAFLARDTSGTGRFMTLFYLELDPAGRAMAWVRAGHDPAMLHRASTGLVEELAGPGIPLGVLEDREFAESSGPWPGPGDVLLLGSDGLWESRGPDGAMFGKQRVRELLGANAGRPAREIVDALLAGLRAFMGGVPAEDDVTLLVIKAVS